MMMKITRKSLAEEVATNLQDRISQGYYKVQEKLPIETELMKSFGVGRSTIREAIKLLANTGLLRVQQGVGTFVERTTSIDESMNLRLKRAAVADLNEMREMLEMKIAEKAALNRTDRHLSEIQRYLSERKTAADGGLLEACVEADIQFHIAIAEASGNEILADLYKAAAVHLKSWFLNSFKDTAPFKETYHLHEQLFKHISDSDSLKAWAVAAEIIKYSHQ